MEIKEHNRTFEKGTALPVIAKHVNDKNILQIRITDLEKEVITLKNKLLDSEEFIMEMLSYKEGLEKENRRLMNEKIHESMVDIDVEMLSRLK